MRKVTESPARTLTFIGKNESICSVSCAPSTSTVTLFAWRAGAALDEEGESSWAIAQVSTPSARRVKPLVASKRSTRPTVQPPYRFLGANVAAYRKRVADHQTPTLPSL